MARNRARSLSQWIGVGIGMVVVATMSPLPPLERALATAVSAGGTVVLIGWRLWVGLTRRPPEEKRPWWSFLL